jgi:hypothetical protein
VGVQADEVIGFAHRAQGLLAGGPFLLLLAWALAMPAQAQPVVLDGVRTIALHARDGTKLEIGQVRFVPRGDGHVAFTLALDSTRFTDHFLSMREFKCLSGKGEILCHVPYPYAQPGTVTNSDLGWLEHSLLFMYKLPSEFGAKLWNGVYFRLKPEGRALVGTPQAVDLNLIGAPPARTDVQPYGPARRDDIRPGTRWFERLTIE